MIHFKHLRVVYIYIIILSSIAILVNSFKTKKNGSHLYIEMTPLCYRRIQYMELASSLVLASSKHFVDYSLYFSIVISSFCKSVLSVYSIAPLTLNYFFSNSFVRLSYRSRSSRIYTIAI